MNKQINLVYEKDSKLPFIYENEDQMNSDLSVVAGGKIIRNVIKEKLSPAVDDIVEINTGKAFVFGLAASLCSPFEECLPYTIQLNNPYGKKKICHKANDSTAYM